MMRCLRYLTPSTVEPDETLRTNPLRLESTPCSVIMYCLPRLLPAIRICLDSVPISIFCTEPLLVRCATLNASKCFNLLCLEIFPNLGQYCDFDGNLLSMLSEARILQISSNSAEKQKGGLGLKMGNSYLDHVPLMSP